MKPARARYRKIDDIVRDLLKEYGYQCPPVDVFNIARGSGLQIRIADLDGLSVVLKREKGEATVVLNRSELPIRHRFAVAHALGHKILHPDIDEHTDAQFLILGRNNQLSFDMAIREKEASYFAACLLLPSRSVIEEIRSCPQDEFGETDIHFLAKKFVVSSNLMLLRVCGMENQFHSIPLFNLKQGFGER